MPWTLVTWVLFIACLASQAFSTVEDNIVEESKKPSFEVDYAKGTFLLDGEPFRYISGSIHYFRIHPSQWNDRLKGLYSLVRIGPYACAEWENGGLPYWLLIDQKTMKQRSSDKRFTKAFASWYAALAGKVRPLLRHNGGPVLMIQIENEYGTYDACDHHYTNWLRDETKKLLGVQTVIYTTNPPSNRSLHCGSVKETLTTVDFGPTNAKNIRKNFDLLKKYLPQGKGPLVNSEFYPGWFVLWGQKTQNLSSFNNTIESLKTMYELGASINVYMIHGGTNFGFWNGAEESAPVITSYDYTAPITESGNYTPAFYAIRNWIKSLPDWSSAPTSPPRPILSKAYPSVKMQLRPLSQLRKVSCNNSKNPLSFEEIGQDFGYVLYYTRLEKCGQKLKIPIIKDFGYVFMNEKRQGTFVKRFYEKIIDTVILDKNSCEPGSRLEILVENQGRQTYQTINDYKGILSDVRLDGDLLQNWIQCKLSMPLESMRNHSNNTNFLTGNSSSLPFGIFYGWFDIFYTSDTYVNMRGWGKGHVELNGHNLGRYWSSQGPQYTLYVPAALLKVGSNHITVVELEGATHKVCPRLDQCTLKFTDRPDIHFDEVTHQN